jgi:hypothetical protein
MLVLFLGVAAVLAQTGCVGVTAKTAPSSQSTTTTNDSAPSITGQPANQSVAVGQTATFSVGASGTAPLTYQWSKNGAVLSGATSASYTTPATVSGDNGAAFSVTVSNATGNVTSNGATLSVTAAPVAPSISAQPVGQTVTAGQSATFAVAATGTTPLTYQWNKNGGAIAGAIASSYTTPATATADNGSAFSVTVSNSVSSTTSSSATLTVSTANYVISAAPTSFAFTGTVNGAAPAQQTVTFISTPATPLPFTMTANQSWITMSATSGTTKAILQFGVNTTGMTAGTYTGQVLVTPTGAGDPPMTIPVSLTLVASTPGTLTANVSTLNFNTVSVGTGSTLQATLTNSGTSSVDISNVSISGAGFTASGVPTGTILNAGQTATLNVTFDPSAAGSVTGSVTVASNATDAAESIALSGTGAQTAQHSVSLVWGSTGSVAGYNVYQSTVSGGPYTKLNASLDSAESYTDNTVQAGQTYYYVVTSVNSSGEESVYSNEVSVVIP